MNNKCGTHSIIRNECGHTVAYGEETLMRRLHNIRTRKGGHYTLIADAPTLTNNPSGMTKMPQCPGGCA